MNAQIMPYLIEAEDLNERLTTDNLCIIDLGTLEQYNKKHIPDAIHLDVNLLKLGKKPAPGLLPSIDALSSGLNSIGLSENSIVVCYDHDNGSHAARMMWTLALIQQKQYAMLNGGITAWIGAGLSLQTQHNSAIRGNRIFQLNRAVLADKSDVLDAIENPDIVILDARSKEEFNGEKSPSERKGHIPGAVNLNWLDTIDQQNFKKLKSAPEIHQMLETIGIEKDTQIIAHCQTHMRSSHSFVVLNSLGYKNVKGYAGSWSQWASDPNLPITKPPIIEPPQIQAE